MNIKFLGGTKTVTGSCYLITTEKYKILLECGQYQGNKTTEALNRERFEFDPTEIDFMILSHAHIDHSGRIPLLIKKGYEGDIYCTKATADLTDILLKDSGYIHEKETEWENKKRLRNGRELIEPLYTFEDAEESVSSLKSVLYEQKVILNEDISLRFNDAGHILGSAIVELWVKDEKGETIKIVFSGDLGMVDKPILRDPTRIENADYLIMESTYGGRLHEESESRIKLLMNIILDTIRRNGTVIIPAFAVGRTQEIIFELNKYYEYNKEVQKELEDINVYVDSPLATTATEIFQGNANDFDEETKQYILNGDNPLDFKNLIFTRLVEESRALNSNKDPKIVISASGMCEAGRIKHHLKHNLWDPKAAVVFVGYQAEGTLGRRILEGEKDLKILGEKIHVNAKIHSIEGFSGHADQRDLLDWLGGFRKMPKGIFLVHGEQDSKEILARKIKEEYNYDVMIAETLEEFHLNTKAEIVGKCDLTNIKFKQLADLDERLHSLREAFEGVLYTTRLKVNREMQLEEFNEIKNKVIEIESDLTNLGISLGE